MVSQLDLPVKVKSGELKALLARLEAAEKVCEAYFDEHDNDHLKCDESCTNGYYQRESLKVYETWRKSKGE